MLHIVLYLIDLSKICIIWINQCRYKDPGHSPENSPRDNPPDNILITPKWMFAFNLRVKTKSLVNKTRDFIHIKHFLVAIFYLNQ